MHDRCRVYVSDRLHFQTDRSLLNHLSRLFFSEDIKNVKTLNRNLITRVMNGEQLSSREGYLSYSWPSIEFTKDFRSWKWPSVCLTAGIVQCTPHTILNSDMLISLCRFHKNFLSTESEDGFMYFLLKEKKNRQNSKAHEQKNLKY